MIRIRTLWTFKKYVLQPWHNYRNKNLEIYLCSTQPDKANIKINTIYLYFEENQIKYICLVKNYKHENDQETQIITIDTTNLAIYQQLKQELTAITGTKPLSSDYERNEFFNLLKPKWLPIYIPLKNYSYSGENRKKEEQQTPQRYIEDALLADYNISSQDLLELKKGLGYEQNILFILDGYDELGKGNNPNFSQALLGGYEDILLCPQRPNEGEINEDFIYIYLNKEKIHLLIKKIEHTGKASIIDKQITEATLSEKLKKHLLEIQALIATEPTVISEATVIEKFFVYTAKNHQRDLKSHGLRWKYAKIFITGRPEHFDNEEGQHLEAFAILDKHNPMSDSFKVNYMARFTSEEIEAYINKYKQADPKCEQELAKLEKNHCKTTFEILGSFGNLKELLINPFLLNITLQALPMLIKKTDISVTRASIYEAFIEYWYTKEIARKGKSLTFYSAAECYHFAEQLAMQMFIHNTISISEKKPELWEFFNRLDHTFAREVCPLRRSGNEYSFIHKSIYEYLLARYLMDLSWEDIQKINGIERGYTASIACLLTKEPSVFSFIQNFARPFICIELGKPVSMSLENLQKKNLYNIFLELLRWGEHESAIKLITDPLKITASFIEKELIALFKDLLTKAPSITTLNITNTLALCATIYSWSQQKTKEKLLILMQPYYHKIANQTNIFLNIIGWGEQDLAERMLQLNPMLGQHVGNLTDCSGRICLNITALQYSLLALDYYMWSMILNYISKEEARVQIEGLIKVARIYDKKGWVIEDNIDWPSLSWYKLINALEEYAKQSEISDISRDSILLLNKQWSQQVGDAQLTLPAHIINEYSHPNRTKGFKNCMRNDTDIDASLPRTGLADWINNDGRKLGIHFAWLRADFRARVVWQVGNMGLLEDCGDYFYVKNDAEMMITLFQTRTRQAQSVVSTITQDTRNKSTLTLK